MPPQRFPGLLGVGRRLYLLLRICLFLVEDEHQYIEHGVIVSQCRIDDTLELTPVLAVTPRNFSLTAPLRNTDISRLGKITTL